MTAGPIFEPWIHGVDPQGAEIEPPIQVQWFGDRTAVLRQSKVVDYEAPFLFLLFGDDRAFLLDSGATVDAAAFPLRATVDALVADWLAQHPREGYELVVAHTHAHGDHVAGDAQFVDRPNTTIVGTDVESVRSFYGFGAGPDQVARLDLGDRVLEVIRIPGHDETSIALFDAETGWLLTGDSVYPGRLYVTDGPAFVASVARLDDFAGARPVTAILGCHIEMTRTPGVDYPTGTLWQPDEPPLELTVAHLAQLREVADVALVPGRCVFDDFIIESR